MSRRRVNPMKEELKLLQNNPFVSKEFIIRIRKRIEVRKFVRDKDGDLVHAQYDQEIQPSTRVYISSEIRQRIALLSHPAAALFLWILYETQEGKDYVVVNRQRYVKEHCHKTDTQIKQALFDLTRYQFVTPTILHDVYWINPRYLFNGNRILKYRSRLKIEE